MQSLARQSFNYWGPALPAISPDARLLAASAIQAGSIDIWDLTTGRKMHSL